MSIILSSPYKVSFVYFKLSTAEFEPGAIALTIFLNMKIKIIPNFIKLVYL